MLEIFNGGLWVFIVLSNVGTGHEVGHTVCGTGKYNVSPCTLV